jgi:hypothetical protein
VYLSKKDTVTMSVEKEGKRYDHKRVESYLGFKNTTKYHIKLFREAAGTETSEAIVALHMVAILLSDILLWCSKCPPQQTKLESPAARFKSAD